MQNALSFVFLDSNINALIKNIYLFGSASRGDLTKESDIDIFVDCDKEDLVEKITKTAILKFYKSKDYDKWKQLDFSYPIAVQAGNLMKWHLKTSIQAEGILLFSKESKLISGERKVIFNFNLPKDKKKYLYLIRSLFGRKEKGYKEHGLLLDVNGEKLSSNLIIIPKENQQRIIEFLNKEKINYNMKEIIIL